ncbi:MAG: tetratricopeptide repeat protein [Saprospirales bacterium]|nr:tetratricopeptide repeat protein [Saprospirales bacterium]
MPSIPPAILEAIQNNRLILWIGAGFSQRRLGLPNWREMVVEMVRICLPAAEAAEINSRLDSEVLREIQALELLKDHAGTCHGIIHDRFNIRLDRSDGRLEDFHLLWQISSKIITTNYDTGLDLTNPGAVPTVIYHKDHQLKNLLAGNKFYFKLHGCASEPTHHILFEQEYEDLYRDTSDAKLDALSDEDTAAKFLLKHLLTDHTVLFIGFGMEDRVDFVLKYIHRLLGKTASPKFALVRNDHTTDWPHTEKWPVGDWAEIPGILKLLADEAARYRRPVVLGDTAMPFDRPYVGRDADVEAVETFFRESGNFFYLYGAGGMGKSHLLDTVQRRLPPEQQPVYFRIERHYTVLTITQKLGIEPVAPVAPPKNPGDPYPPNQHLLQAFEQVGRPLVFDDFYEISDPALFYTLLELPKRRGIKSIIISRSLPPAWLKFDAGVHHRELHELGQSHFEDCLRGLAAEMQAYVDLPPNQHQLDTCWQLCGGYPLGGQLLLGLLAEPGFDAAHLERLDLAADPSRSHFVGRLLSAILEKGTDAERNLARDIAVFTEPVPETALTKLPSWAPDRIAFFALWRRKGLLFRRTNDQRFGMHALVRSMLLQQLGDSPEARACAGRYYESLTGLREVERVVALQKALEHYDLSPEEERDAFRQRVQRDFVAVNVVQLRDEQDPALAIERFRFRLQLNPGDAAAANELGMAYRRQGNLEKAIEVLEKAAEAGNVHAMNELSITLREAGKLDDAIQVLQKATELQPNNVILINELGITLREAGKLDDAIQVLQKATQLSQTMSF